MSDTAGLVVWSPFLVTGTRRPKRATIQGVTILSPDSAKMYSIMTR